MENKKNWLGMLVIVLVLGITVFGCDNGSTNDNGSDLDGIWISNTNMGGFGFIRFNASGGILIESMADSKNSITWADMLKATYPKNAKSPVTCTITEVNTIMFGESPGEWKTWENLNSTEKTNAGGSKTWSITISNNQFTANGGTFEKY